MAGSLMRTERIRFTVEGRDAGALEREGARLVAEYRSGRDVLSCSIDASPKVIAITGEVVVWEADVEVEFAS